MVAIFLALAVDPVVQGKTRAEQFYRGDEDGKEVIESINQLINQSVNESIPQSTNPINQSIN